MDSLVSSYLSSIKNKDLLCPFCHKEMPMIYNIYQSNGTTMIEYQCNCSQVIHVQPLSSFLMTENANTVISDNQCPIHKDCSLDFYCKSCHIDICIQCIEKYHTTHSTSSLDALWNNKKRVADIINKSTLQNDVIKGFSNYQTFLGNVITDVGKAIKDLTQLQSTLKSKLDEDIKSNIEEIALGTIILNKGNSTKIKKVYNVIDLAMKISSSNYKQWNKPQLSVDNNPIGLINRQINKFTQQINKMQLNLFKSKGFYKKNHLNFRKEKGLYTIRYNKKAFRHSGIYSMHNNQSIKGMIPIEEYHDRAIIYSKNTVYAIALRTNNTQRIVPKLKKKSYKISGICPIKNFYYCIYYTESNMFIIWNIADNTILNQVKVDYPFKHCKSFNYKGDKILLCFGENDVYCYNKLLTSEISNSVFRDSFNIRNPNDVIQLQNETLIALSSNNIFYLKIFKRNFRGIFKSFPFKKELQIENIVQINYYKENMFFAVDQERSMIYQLEESDCSIIINRKIIVPRGYDVIFSDNDNIFFRTFYSLQLYNVESKEKKDYDAHSVITVIALEDNRFAAITSLDTIYVYSYFGTVETVIDYRTFEDNLTKMNFFYRDHCFYIYSKKNLIIIE